MLFKIPFRAAIICGALILLGPTAFAQARIGSIQGTVKDPGGALVPNATITVTQPVTGYRQTAQTDAQGSFKLVNLAFNTYKVRAESAGFHPRLAAFALSLGVRSRVTDPPHPRTVSSTAVHRCGDASRQRQHRLLHPAAVRR